MSFALKTKTITCPNCHYEGKAKVKGSGGGQWLLFLVLLVVSFFFWPLFIVAGIMFVWLVFKPAKQVCPKCNYEYVVGK